MRRCAWRSYCHGTKLEWCSSSVDEDGVAGAEVREAPRVGDEVDRLGGVADEDDLALGRRVDEGAYLLAGVLRAPAVAFSPST